MPFSVSPEHTLVQLWGNYPPLAGRDSSEIFHSKKHGRFRPRRGPGPLAKNVLFCTFPMQPWEQFDAKTTAKK